MIIIFLSVKIKNNIKIFTILMYHIQQIKLNLHNYFFSINFLMLNNTLILKIIVLSNRSNL